MKTEDLKAQGLTDEQISFVMAENGKDLKKLQKENENLTSDRDAWKEKAETAEETLKGFEGIDPKNLQEELANWKSKAQNAEKEAQKQLLQRDQRDYLKEEFDKLGIESPRIRDSLMHEIMGDDGLKWKNGAFMGLSDYLSKENEKEHFYQTQEEKDAAAAQQQAQRNAAHFSPVTAPRGQQTPPGTMTRKEIDDIKDATERQNAIAHAIKNNLGLYPGATKGD